MSLRFHLLLLASLATSTGCVLFDGTFACESDDTCAFGRVCGPDGRCVDPANLVGEGVGEEEDAGVDAGQDVVGEGEGEPPGGEGEIEDPDGCEVITPALGTLTLLDNERVGLPSSKCVKVDGSVVITGTRTSLVGMEKVILITGTLSARGTALASFNGATTLEKIGSLEVRENDGALTSFAGLAAVQEVPVKVTIRDNEGFLDAAALAFVNGLRVKPAETDVRDNGPHSKAHPRRFRRP